MTARLALATDFPPLSARRAARWTRFDSANDDRNVLTGDPCVLCTVSAWVFIWNTTNSFIYRHGMKLAEGVRFEPREGLENVLKPPDAAVLIAYVGSR